MSWLIGRRAVCRQTEANWRVERWEVSDAYSTSVIAWTTTQICPARVQYSCVQHEMSLHHHHYGTMVHPIHAELDLIQSGPSICSIASSTLGVGALQAPDLMTAKRLVVHPLSVEQALHRPNLSKPTPFFLVHEKHLKPSQESRTDPGSALCSSPVPQLMGQEVSGLERSWHLTYYNMYLSIYLFIYLSLYYNHVYVCMYVCRRACMHV